MSKMRFDGQFMPVALYALGAAPLTLEELRRGPEYVKTRALIGEDEIFFVASAPDDVSSPDGAVIELQCYVNNALLSNEADWQRYVDTLWPDVATAQREYEDMEKPTDE